MAQIRRYVRRYRDRSDEGPGRIVLVLMSRIDPVVVEALQTELEKIFKRPVEVREKLQSLRFAYVEERDQYLSPALLSKLRRLKKPLCDRILGVVNVDLYSPGYEFVYGEADVGCGVGTVSTYRLEDGSLYAPGKTAERTVKEAVHELGHLYGLGHCPDASCVMRFSTRTKTIDTKKQDFCDKCRGVI
jgi:archaemetzincin